jgi:pilus assembly protein CpaD
MNTARLYPFGGAIVLLGIALVFSACAPQTSQWSPVEAQKENKLTLVRLAHSIQFRPNEDRLSPAEVERLAVFMRDQAVGYGDQIVLLGGESVVEQRRQQSVAQMFARGGLRVIRGAQIEGMTAEPNEVRILVSRYVVTPPNCPNWSKRADDDFGNTSSSNLGCATATNLGLMVADPADLMGGRPLGPAEGEVAAFSVERYRAGRIIPLLRGDARPNSRTEITKEPAK